MRKRFIPAEEVSHLNSAGLVLVDHFKCCEALIHAEMDMNHVYFRSQRGAPAQLGLAQQRYAKSHRIFANSLGVKDFRQFRNSHDGTCFSRSVLGA